MKPKEYLLKHGYIDEIKRGRLSLDHIEVIKDAVANGEYIEGYSLDTGPAGTPQKATNAVKRDPVSNGKEIVELMPYRYPEDKFVAYEYRDGKKVKRSLREICRNCGVSMVCCVCGSPRAVAHDGRGDVAIYIEEAK